MLQIDNLHATVAGKPILKGLSLAVNAGEIHAIMGPNGAGKSTLAYVLGGRPGYEVTGGSVTFDGQDLLALEPHERAAAGLFLGFQYPVEIPGVSNVQFLREALNAQRKARGRRAAVGRRVPQAGAREGGAAADRHGHAQAAGERRLLGRREEARRDGPDGHPRSRARGARRDRLRPRHRRAARSSARASTRSCASPTRRVLLITHYQRLLDYVQPDFVHVLAGGPHRQDRRARAGAPARERRLRGGGGVTLTLAALPTRKDEELPLCATSTALAQLRAGRLAREERSSCCAPGETRAQTHRARRTPAPRRCTASRADRRRRRARSSCSRAQRRRRLQPARGRRAAGARARTSSSAGRSSAAATQTLEIVTDGHAMPSPTRPAARSCARCSAGTATGTFLGRVEVARGAQKTDAAQSVRAMLLDRSATANAKPELEIFADDVKCAHGCAVGELDATAAVLPGSRAGLPRREAQAADAAGVHRRRLRRRARTRRARQAARRRARSALGDAGCEHRSPTPRRPRRSTCEADFPGLRQRRRQPLALSRYRRHRAEAAGGDRRDHARARRRLRHRPPRRLHALGRDDARLRGGAAAGGGVHRRARGRDRLHPRRDRGDQPRRAQLGRAQLKAGDRMLLSRARASFEHRALAAAARAHRHRDRRLPADRTTAGSISTRPSGC